MTRSAGSMAVHGPDRCRRRGAGALLAILACCVPLALVARGRGHRITDEADTARMPPMLLAPLGVSPPDGAGVDGAWLPEVEERFDPSVCPSLEAAARVLGRRIALRLATLVPDRQAPALVLLSAGRFDAAESALAEVASVLRSRHDAAQVQIEAPGPQQPADGGEGGVVSVHLDLARSPELRLAATAPAASAEPWSLGATVKGAAGQRTEAMAFFAKPWVADFAAFVSANPSRRWVLGRCLQLATDPQDAERQALADAARLLASEAVDVAGSPMVAGARFKAEVTARILAGLRVGRFVVDRFAQRLSRPYGDLWRQAVLVSFDPAELAELVRSVGADRRVGRQAARATVLAIAALALLVCGLYLFLSAATRGYYDRPLRVVLGLLAVACLVLLAWLC